MLVSDVLRRKGGFVATVPPTTTVAELLAELARHNIGALVVSADGATVDGIVSERDVVRALHTTGADALGAQVNAIMTAEVSATSPDDNVQALMRLMTESRIRHVPVVADGRLRGIVSIGDVVKSRMDELESDRESLIGYINTAS